MSSRFGNRPVLSSLLVLLSLTGLPAHAQTIKCKPVTSLPANLSTSGVWCLTGDLTAAQTNGVAITISANNATLDLNGWTLSGQAAGTGTTAIGIYSNAFNVTVKNGTVRGFIMATDFNGRGAVVENILADQITGTGIMVAGQGSMVRNCRVIDTGGSTGPWAGDAVGIAAGGGVDGSDRNLIEGNVVAGLTAKDGFYEYGIVLGGSHSLAINNFITDTAPPSGGGTSYGIWSYRYGTSDNVVHNTVSNFNTCIFYDNSYPGATGIYARNTVTSCDSAYVGGTAGPGNAP